MFNPKNIIPDEWQSAHAAMRDMQANASKTAHPHIKNLVSFVVPFATGTYLGGKTYVLINESFQLAVLTFVGILTGFVVTLMLFTGRQNGMESLSLENAKQFKDKVIYLLWSQSATLTTYLLTAITALVWLAVVGDDPSFKDEAVGNWAQMILGSISIGFLLLAIVRTILLPYQIYELHNYSLSLLVHDKEKELDRDLSDKKQSIPDDL